MKFRPVTAMYAILTLALFAQAWALSALATDVFDTDENGNLQNIGQLDIPGVESIIINRAPPEPVPPVDPNIHVRTPEEFLPTLTACKGGETIIMHAGEYPAFINEGSENLYSDWVTIKAAEGEKVVIECIKIGNRSSQHLAIDGTGTFNSYLRLVGIEIIDGVDLKGGNFFELIDCIIKRRGPDTGSEEVMDSVTVALGIADGLIKNCEITDGPIGIVASGRRTHIIGNHIHHLTHDGIRCVGLKDSLIEGNHIHDLDDGYDNDDNPGWGRHVDGIHIFIPGPGIPERIVSNLTFRSNKVYDLESHGVQFNNYGSVRNANITFENNIFGPCKNNCFNGADPVDGLTFRHNAFIAGSREYTSQFRTLLLENTILRINETYTNVKVYNNILGNPFTPPPKEDWHIGFNLLSVYTSTTVQLRNSIYADPLFMDKWAFDGRVSPTSLALNAGTAKHAPVVEKDFYGVTRDARPDIGAVELEGQYPPAEPDLLVPPENPTVFLEDFADGDFIRVDPWLTDATSVGLSWTGSGHEVIRFDNRNVVGGLPPANTLQLLLSNRDFGNISVDFTLINRYIETGDGFVFCVQDNANFYWLDLGKFAGRLIKVKDGVQTLLAESPALRPSHGGSKVYRVNIQHTAEGTVIGVDANSVRALDYIDPNGLGNGKIGFGRLSTKSSIKNLYHSIRVESK